MALSLRLTGIPIPQLALTFGDIIPELNKLQVKLFFFEYTPPFQTKSMIDVLAITIALMVGTAGLPHVIVRFYTVPDVRSARYSAGWALLFIAILYTMSSAVSHDVYYRIINPEASVRVQVGRGIIFVATTTHPGFGRIGSYPKWCNVIIR